MQDEVEFGTQKGGFRAVFGWLYTINKKNPNPFPINKHGIGSIVFGIEMAGGENNISTYSSYL